MFMPLIILVINILYISLLTIRTMFIFKGQRYYASAVSAAEAFVFVLGIGLVIDNLENIINLFAYAAGFALGILVGTKIEDRLALGYVTVKVISKDCDYPLPRYLRRKGYGVTSWIGDGRGGKRLVMEILSSRKDQKDLYTHIVSCDPEAFVISYEPQHFRGGFWVKSLRKYCKKYGKPLDFPFDDHFPDVEEEIPPENQGVNQKEEK